MQNSINIELKVKGVVNKNNIDKIEAIIKEGV